jgi:tetratricopeptide (TPR) repeat protein
MNHDETIQLKSDDAEVFYNREKLQFGSGQFEEALENFNKAIELKPMPTAAFYYPDRGNSIKQ